MDTAILITPHIPKVSIGMPVYNGEPFICKALDSLLAQTFTDFELIISDNASIDKTEQICREYAAKDKRIRYIRQEINRGAMPNFQYVLDEAVGEYFMWAAHDDWWHPAFIKELSALLDTDKESVIAFCRMQHVHIGGEVFENYPKITAVASEKNYQNKNIKSSFTKYLEQRIIYGKVNLIYGLIRRDILLKAEVVKKWGNFGWGADLLIVAQILRYGNVIFSENYLFKKCLNPDSEGSLKDKTINKKPINIILGVSNTWKCYNKYIYGIWLVQGRNIDIPSVPMINRIYITLREFLKINIGFTIQIFKAIRKRVYKI